MTTSEFQAQLDAANTLSELIALRGVSFAPKFVGMVKAKSHIIAIKEGFTFMTVREDSFYKISPTTNVGTINTFEVPKQNRTVTGFAGKTVICFINDKVRTKKQLVEIYVKTA
jgi:hypothetical protein